MFFCLAPMPLGILPGEIVEWSCVICKVAYKDAVKVAETEEGSDVLDFCWHRPVLDARNFDRVHASHPPSKDYPQVIHFRCMEQTFVQQEEEVVGSGNV